MLTSNNVMLKIDITERLTYKLVRTQPHFRLLSKKLGIEIIDMISSDDLDFQFAKKNLHNICILTNRILTFQGILVRMI